MRVKRNSMLIRKNVTSVPAFLTPRDALKPARFNYQLRILSTSRKKVQSLDNAYKLYSSKSQKVFQQLSRIEEFCGRSFLERRG
jgi:hypothetical protein